MLDNIYKIDRSKGNWKKCINSIFIDMDIKRVNYSKYTVFVAKNILEEIAYEGTSEEIKQIKEIPSSWQNTFEIKIELDKNLKEDEMKVVINE